jgi:DNA-binding CsgD family transcriptional regulator
MSSAAALRRLPEQTSNVSVLPNPAKRGTERSAPLGLVLLDSSLTPMYCNSDAIRILAYPKELHQVKQSSPEFLKQIRSIIREMPSVDESPVTVFFTSGRRRYVGRCFLLEHDPGRSLRPAVAITIDRVGSILRHVVMRFQLTQREVEAVQYLARGLTSKEIAERMNISPNTVKTFLRLVMVKMGVTTRTGVIGKLMDAAQLGDQYYMEPDASP